MNNASRSRDVLLGDFEAIKTLQQYLYMDERHYISIKNAIGVVLEIRMRENLHYYCKNTNFPEMKETCWSDNMTNETMISIIEQLKEMPAVEMPEFFKNRWEEISTICKSNVVQNEISRR